MDASERRAKRSGDPAHGVGRHAPHNDVEADLDAWFDRLDALNDEPFMPKDRTQPVTPPGSINFDD